MVQRMQCTLVCASNFSQGSVAVVKL